MSKLSIIIPVYNVEIYIRECLDSIINQTFTDFEVLLINDGSQDKSGSICDEYAEKDRRFRVFHKENGGVSSARNIGLDNATGEWITFMDPDDYFIGDNAFEKLFSNKLLDIQVVSFSMILGESIETGVKTIQPETGFVNIRDNKKIVFELSYACANLIRKDVIDNLRFDTRLTIGEDALFIREVLLKSSKILILEEAYYFYRIRKESATNPQKGYMKTFVADFIKLIETLIHKYKDSPNWDEDAFRKFKVDKFYAILWIENNNKSISHSAKQIKSYREAADIEPEFYWKNILRKTKRPKLMISSSLTKLKMYKALALYYKLGNIQSLLNKK